MRIGIDIRSLLEEHWSGVGVYTDRLLHALFKLDTGNEYYLYSNSFREPARDIVYDAVNVQIVRTNIPNKLYNGSIVLFNRPRLDRLLPAIDVFWSPAHNFLSVSNQVKTVVTCHDLSWKVFPRFYSVKGKLWHQLIRMEKLLRQADAILAVSQHTKTDLERLFLGLKGKVFVTPLGVETIPISADAVARVSQRLNLPDRYILYLGNIEPRKNIEMVLEAYREVKRQFSDVSLVVAGALGWHRGYARHMMHLMQGMKDIHYFGYVTEEEKSVIMQRASIFFFPSFYEGFGLPALEAMQYGCPVVTSTVSSLPEVVGDAGLLVDPYNVSQAVFALRSILTDAELRERLVLKGKDRATRFSWEETARTTLEIFKQIAL